MFSQGENRAFYKILLISYLCANLIFLKALGNLLISDNVMYADKVKIREINRL